MNILVVDMLGCRYPDLGYQIKTALESLGHHVRSFDYRYMKLQHISMTNKLLNRRLVKAATSWPADLVIVNKGESILAGTIASIGKQGIKTANWNPDEPFGELQAFNRIKNVEEYDAFFTYDAQYVEPLKKLNPNTFYLPPGADPFGVHKEHTPLDARAFEADICLVGTAYQNRIDLLKDQTRSLLLAGPGWDKAPARLASHASPPVKIDEMIRMFNKSKIVLNPYGSSKAFIVPNPRTFEIPASRSFELTDIPRDVERFFKVGKEIVVYHDEKEFKELVDYYAEHDDERNKIAQAGYDRVINEHTMTHRLRELQQRMKL